MDDDDRLRRAENLFWQRSQRYLRRGEPFTDLSRLWEACLLDAGVPPDAGADRGGWDTHTASLVLETKALDTWALELKEDHDGTLVGYAAAFSKDLVNDVIQPGAFSKTIAEAEAFQRQHKSASLLPLLWQHQKDEPIGGVISAKEDRHGLRCRYRLDRSTPRGNQAYNGLKDGYLSFSIGYKPVKYTWRGSERHLSEIALAEVSAVTFPANRDARALPSDR